ncbi:unnamed protein product [Brassicogethes aeneus]|uniref:DALR anticodon binding domain-containing protein n=1 Tax=Brassicogethes aeneus TaxID=1431903 RepID=A0A9P0FGX0_BRAAE|nr:unnamed protein product [Brassicogethes aeneus]
MDLEDFISNLSKYLIGDTPNNSNIIRKHTRNLDVLGDISFPLNLKNWHNLLDSSKVVKEGTIFDNLNHNKSWNNQLEDLKKASEEWRLHIFKFKKIKNDLHIFLLKHKVFAHTLPQVFNCGDSYGSSAIIKRNINVIVDADVHKTNETKDLTQLRITILHNTLNNLVKYCEDKNTDGECSVYLSSKHVANPNCIICGPILNKDNMKDTETTAEDIFRERRIDMMDSAQHRFHVPVTNTPYWQVFFQKLGKGAVTIELLSVKPNKATKLLLKDSRTANKGPAFIFYNCARLSVLFKEFDKHVKEKNTYPELPSVDQIDFKLLNQPEEWELLYVYILQFPLIVQSCVKDLEKGIYNPQNLVQFLSNLSSVFSIYYRRVRILIKPRDHLYSQIHARIYLLKALEVVYHNSLRLLNIEPIKHM